MFSDLMKKKKPLLAWLLAILTALSLGFAVFGTPVQAVSQAELDALKRQQQELAAQKAGIQAQANALNDGIASQTEQLELLAQQLTLTNSELENLSEQIAIYTNTIAELENDLNARRREEQELLKHYKARVRAMEESGGYSYISILLGASSFEDLLGRVDCVRSIAKYDNDLIDAVQAAQARVEAAKTDMEIRMAEQEAVFEEYQRKQADLLTQQEEVTAVLLTLETDSDGYQSQLEAVNTLQSALGGQISDMQDKLAELARIQAEQRAANDAASGSGGVWYGDASGGTGTGQDVVAYAQSFLGVQYVYGGTSPSGFDCSGLVYYCYRHYGYTLNRTAAGLAYNGTAVSSTALQPGDIILFTSTDGSYIGHTGIYVGSGQFIHAPHTGDVVKISNLSDTYYTNHYWGARRIIS
ncbi:MAG: C40 family peptidase [Oscillospiraceae bacterium]|jgi:cell wall-associated NlpC family hydrolase|nr:C40 family peptidase [Oscillospiraceae bacterium]